MHEGNDIRMLLREIKAQAVELLLEGLDASVYLGIDGLGGILIACTRRGPRFARELPLDDVPGIFSLSKLERCLTQ